jgi:penicillin-binding protein A
MNKPMRKVAVAVAILFVALFVNLNYVQVVRGSHYRNDKYNQRVLYNEFSSPRGQIVLSDGTPIAYSKKTNDELKYQRVYPDGPVYAPITGYYSFTYGTSGIEDAEDSILTGDDPRLFGTKLAGLLTGRNPQGGTVDLTVNKQAQLAAYKAMDGRPGAVVALDPTTGAILAAVSTPSFDPNTLANHNSAKVSAAWSAYLKAKNNPLSNRDFNEIYPLGSVFKVIDSAAAFEQDSSLEPTTVVPAPNSYWPLDPTRTSGCGSSGACIANFDGETCDNGKTAQLQFAFAKSCNTAFAKLVTEKVGSKLLAQEAVKFGLQKPYPGEQPPDACSPPAFMMPLAVCRSYPGSVDDLASPDTLAQTAIGQHDVTVTPLQVAMISAAVADGGTLWKPYLVAREQGPNLSTISTTHPTQLSSVIDQADDQKLITMMEQVVTSPEGTGSSAQVPAINGVPVVVGGKTGTADHCASNAKTCPPPDAWFSGFAMLQGQPKIAVAVIIENGGVNGNETTGGLAAGPVAEKVMAAYLHSPQGS